MSDPTIPRHTPARRRAITHGRYVKQGDKVILTDKWSNTWSLDAVSLLQGSFGFRHDGVEKYPRPWEYDGNGAVVIEGDIVIIDFLDGRPDLPLVMGGCRSSTPHEFFTFNHNSPGADFNRLAVRLRALDSSGNQTGEMRLRVNEQELGAIIASATDRIQLFVGADLDSESGISVTVEDGVLTVTTSGLSEPVILGLTFMTDLSSWITAVTTFLTALSVDATNPAVAAAAVSMLVSQGIFAGKVSSSLSSNAPFLSTHLKTE